MIPAETKVLSVSVKDHICYVNLDKGFLDTTNVMNPELPVLCDREYNYRRKLDRQGTRS